MSMPGFYVLHTEGEEGTVREVEPFPTAAPAGRYAEDLAAIYFGQHRTWFARIGPERYEVGRIDAHGTRSAPLGTIMVDEREDGEDRDR